MASSVFFDVPTLEEETTKFPQNTEHRLFSSAKPILRSK